MLKILKYTACILVLLGALNWGLIGLFGFNLVTALFGEATLFSRIVYIIIGASAVVAAICVFMHNKENNRIDY